MVWGCTLEYRGTDKNLEMLSIHSYFCGVVKNVDGMSGKSTACLSGTVRLLVDCCVQTQRDVGGC